MDWAAAVTAEPAAKMTMETRRTSWRPKMSASLPLRGRTAVHARLYADETHTKESVPLRSWMMDGRAVDTDACEWETHERVRERVLGLGGEGGHAPNRGQTGIATSIRRGR